MYVSVMQVETGLTEARSPGVLNLVKPGPY